MESTFNEKELLSHKLEKVVDKYYNTGNEEENKI